MFDSAAVQPQEQAGRPPDDTLPVETGEPRPFTSVGEIDTGEDFVDTPEARARGKELFERYCAVCHAADATGADLGEDFFAADLTEPEYLERSDEAIYNVIIEGGLSMPSYRAELGRRDPWLVVRHLRSLQRADER